LNQSKKPPGDLVYHFLMIEEYLLNNIFLIIPQKTDGYQNFLSTEIKVIKPQSPAAAGRGIKNRVFCSFVQK